MTLDDGQPAPEDHGAEGQPREEVGPGREVVVHLQAAALEVIGAFRAFLDAVEEVVRDPAGAVALVSSLAGRARGRGSDGGEEGDGDGDGVQRIPVS